ncbi:hypothetical protein [Xanthomonas arboricola]|nr:hypothetical protein [Xanthomonas arboricola]
MKYSWKGIRKTYSNADKPAGSGIADPDGRIGQSGLKSASPHTAVP